MASRYVQPTLAEMDETLDAAKGWVKSETPAGEYVYEFAIKGYPNVVVRIYSTIRKDNGTARGNGQDAIRVFGFNTATSRPLSKSRKVLRVEGWRKNLQAAAVDCIAYLRLTFPLKAATTPPAASPAPKPTLNPTTPPLPFKGDWKAEAHRLVDLAAEAEIQTIEGGQV